MWWKDTALPKFYSELLWKCRSVKKIFIVYCADALPVTVQCWILQLVHGIWHSSWLCAIILGLHDGIAVLACFQSDCFVHCLRCQAHLRPIILLNVHFPCFSDCWDGFVYASQQRICVWDLLANHRRCPRVLSPVVTTVKYAFLHITTALYIIHCPSHIPQLAIQLRTPALSSFVMNYVISRNLINRNLNIFISKAASVETT